MVADYKRVQEEWVSGHTGGSVQEILAVTLVPLTGLLVWRSLPTIPAFRATLVEFLLLVLPLVLAFTMVPVGLGMGSLLLLVFGIHATTLPSRAQAQAQEQNQPLEPLGTSDWTSSPRKPFLSIYRALMMLSTCLAILAVDFPIFPRRFAKVETYGISLMDVGVGSFVFSQGVVASRRRTSSATSTMLRTLRASIPLLLLGSLRLLLVKASDYQEHQSEYGVHWNFFFTLAFLPPLVMVVQKALRSQCLHAGWLGVVVVSAYQFGLTCLGGESWILNAPRVDLLSSNKEGIASLWGYLAIHFFGAQLGDILAKPRSLQQWKHGVFARLLLTILLLWFYYGLASTEWHAQTSRRLCNGMYVLCTLAFNLTVITACLAVDLVFLRGHHGTSAVNVPRILSAINENQLLFFLLANICTGLVNKSMYTIYATPTTALTVLLAYMLLLATIALTLQQKKIRIKF